MLMRPPLPSIGRRGRYLIRCIAFSRGCVAEALAGYKSVSSKVLATAPCLHSSLLAILIINFDDAACCILCRPCLFERLRQFVHELLSEQRQPPSCCRHANVYAGSPIVHHVCRCAPPPNQHPSAGKPVPPLRCQLLGHRGWTNADRQPPHPNSGDDDARRNDVHPDILPTIGHRCTRSAEQH